MNRKLLLLMLAVVFFLNGNAQIITTVAGNGTFGYSGDGDPATAAEIFLPSTVAIDGAGNVYFSDKNNNVIRKVDPSGVISTVAGNDPGGGSAFGTTGGYSGDGGPATAAEFFYPWAVAVDGPGNLYIADRINNVVRKVNTSGIISTFAGKYSGAGMAYGGYSGDGGPATNARLFYPSGVAADASGNVYIADSYNSVIRKVDTSGIISTIAGNHAGTYSGDGGPATAAGIYDPYGMAFDAAGNLYIADRNNYVIRKVDTNGIITTFAGNHIFGYSGDGGPATAASSGIIYGVATDGSGNVYFSDYNSSTIRMVNTSGIISTYAGNDIAGFSGNGGPATAASLNYPLGIAIDGAGSLYIADDSNSMVRRISPTATKINILPDAADFMKVYPNPNTGSFTINISSLNNEQAQISITNMIDEKVFELNAATNKPVDILLNEPPGIYLLNVLTAHGKCSEKLIVTP